MDDHTLIRATLASSIVSILSERWNVSENEALRRFYQSNTARAFADDETGLYGMSALYIAGCCIAEGA